MKDARVKLGYSQRTVAKLLNVSPSIISGYETGERTPSLENLRALAYFYRCSTDYLLGREPAKAEATISVDGLSAHQVHLLTELVATMRG